ncbi:MAG: sulfotransferase, partial [Caulobacterales bacterium]|nr:sulfotransferase [Caulobacterales bacterium]
SGSTMLQRELCRHGSVQHVEYSPHTYFETHHWVKAAVMLGLPAEAFSGGRVYAGYGSPANARSYMVDCVTRNIPDFAAPKDDRELVFAGWEALCARYAQPVFFEKSPQTLAHWASLSLLLEWIAATDHDVRVIGLTRNPMSVLHSAEKLFSTPPHARQFGWLEIQRNLLAFEAMMEEERFIHVKYESIIEQPRDEFARICRFLGLELDDQVGAEVHAKSTQKWRDDPDFALALHPLVAQMAKRFGYGDDDLRVASDGARLAGRRASVAAQRRQLLPKLRDRVLKPALLRLRQWRASPPASRRSEP